MLTPSAFLENLEVKVFNQYQNFVLVFFADERFDLFICNLKLLGCKAKYSSCQNK